MDIRLTPDLSDECEVWKCPVCGGRDVEPVALIELDTDSLGTISGVQVHVRCLRLKMIASHGEAVIYQRLT